MENMNFAWKPWGFWKRWWDGRCASEITLLVCFSPRSFLDLSVSGKQTYSEPHLVIGPFVISVWNPGGPLTQWDHQAVYWMLPWRRGHMNPRVHAPFLLVFSNFVQNFFDALSKLKESRRTKH